MAIFPVSLTCRLGKDEQITAGLVLEIPHIDIANYLGLTHKTVSRAIAELCAAGITAGLRKQLRMIALEPPAEWAINEHSNDLILSRFGM